MAKNTKFRKFDYYTFILVLVSLLVGIFIYDDYGQSTDEYFEMQRAEVALQAYTFADFDEVRSAYMELGIVRFYGTAFSAPALWAAKSLSPILDKPAEELLHFFYFFAFQLGVLSLYYLSKNFLEDKYCFLAAMLFATQPLLFGHGFINPKDIPILSTILVAVTLGFWSAKVIKGHIKEEKNFFGSLIGKIKEDWHEKVKKERSWILILLAYWLLLPGVITLARWLAVKLITIAYTSSEDNFLHQMFLRSAVNLDTVNLEQYVQKTLRLADRGLLVVPLLGLVISLLVFRKLFSKTKTYLYENMVLSYTRLPKKEFRRILVSVSLAGAAWGIAVSTRITGIIAGGMVGLFFFLYLKEKGVLAAIWYTFTALLFSFASWPFLWIVGFRGYQQAFRLFSSFDWSGAVFFRGELYRGNNLPPNYLIELMSVQFTEPLVILSVIGIFVGVALLIKKRIDWQLGVILYAWLLLPVLYSLLGNPVFYGNFRHYLFITPPLFILAGFALQTLGQKVQSKIFMLALSVVVLLPGLMGLVTYHPYQYVYYNQFVGGIEGAVGRYELDYWNTAYKAGMEYINEHAPEGAKILVWRVEYIAQYYQRSDLSVFKQSEIVIGSIEDFDYSLLQNVLKIAQNNLIQEAVVHTVDVHGIPLLYVLDYGKLTP